MRADWLAAGLGQRLGEVTALGDEPAVVGPFDRIEQGLAAQRPVAVLVAVVDHPPATVAAFDHGGVAARPPRFAAVDGAGDRIVRRVLPRAVDRLRTCADHHVPGGRAGRASHRGGHVVPVTSLVDLRAFLGVALHVPVLRVLPAIVDVPGFADHAQAVVGQLHVIAAGQEQVALAVLAHRMAWIDVLAQAEVDRLAPGAADVVGPDHVVAAGAAFGAAGAGREIDVVAIIVFDDVRRPDRADVGRDRMAQRLPVDQVARVPDRQARIGVERGRGQVVVLAVPEHRRIGPVAGEHRVEEGAVAQVGLALVLDAALPGAGDGIGRSGRHRQHQQGNKYGVQFHADTQDARVAEV